MKDRHVGCSSSKSILTRQSNRLQRGMTLLEVCIVAGLVIAVCAMMATSLSGLQGTRRTSAASTVLTILEQARTSAIATGRATAVLLGSGEFPGSDWLRIVQLQADGSEPDRIVALTRRFELPPGIRFHARSPLLDPQVGLPHWLLGNRLASGTSAISFSERGVVEFPPPGKDRLTLFIVDGTSSFSDQRRVEHQFAERIAITRFTGRGRINVTSLDDASSLMQDDQ